VLALVIVAGAAWNGAFGAVPSVYQTAAVRTQSTSPELAGAWINASSNAGIAVGAALGIAGGLTSSAGWFVALAVMAAGSAVAALAVRGIKTGALPVPLAPATQTALEEFREWFRAWL